MVAVKPADPDSFVRASSETVRDSGNTATRLLPRDCYLPTIRLVTTVIAVLLTAGLSACSDSKGPMEFKGKIVRQTVQLDNGKKVDCVVAAANGVSLTCDWAGAH